MSRRPQQPTRFIPSLHNPVLMRSIFFYSAVLFLLTACSATRNSFSTGANNYDEALADSVLAYALDHEALYTLADTLKPISSVKFLRYAIAKDSTLADGAAIVTTKDSLLRTIDQYHKVCAALSGGDWQFILMPFERTEKNTRNLEIYVVRRSVFQKKLQQYSSFFGQWGFTPSADPAVVLPVIEYETKFDRNRAYGYLFGYPAYAVDFFVEGQQTQEKDTARKLVPRDFFAIPVYAGNSGYFTYAMPKGYKPTEVDSAIYRRAAATLNRYKALREKYKTGKDIRARALWAAIRKE